MQSLALNDSSNDSELLVAAGVSLYKDVATKFTRWLLVLCPTFGASAQDTTPTPAPGEPVRTTFEVEVTTPGIVVTGSNIPTAEEVGPQPVYRVNKDDIFQLGVRNATDLIQKLPVFNGISINENVNGGGDGHVEADLRGIGSRETLVLQDGRRVASIGFAGEIGLSGATVDLNVFPLGLIHHIDILLDGASAIYGSDAI